MPIAAAKMQRRYPGRGQKRWGKLKGPFPKRSWQFQVRWSLQTGSLVRNKVDHGNNLVLCIVPNMVERTAPSGRNSAFAVVDLGMYEADTQRHLR